MDLQSIAFDHSATFPLITNIIIIGKVWTLIINELRKRRELNPHNEFSKPVTQPLGLFHELLTLLDSLNSQLLNVLFNNPANIYYF